jgi:hypothetical protein
MRYDKPRGRIVSFLLQCAMCVCLFLQDLVQSCSREGGGEYGRTMSCGISCERLNRCVFTCAFRNFVHICHLSRPALPTRYCHFAPARNRPVPRPLHLEITLSESLQSALTTLRLMGAGSLGQGDSIHAQDAPPHRAEIRDRERVLFMGTRFSNLYDESSKSKGKPPNPTAFAVPIVPGQRGYDPFELREHPGYGLRSPGQNSESVEAEEDDDDYETSEDS